MANALQFLTFSDVWRSMGPEIIVIGGAFLIMLVELFLPASLKRVSPWLAVLALVASATVLVIRLGAAVTTYSTPAYIVDDFGSIFKLIILIATLLVILLAIADRSAESLPYEYSYLVLFATGGAMVISSGVDLVTLYVGLELLSIASYILVALYRKSARSAEGGLKYLIIGSIASACILYGLSFLYGVGGSTNLGQIGVNLQSGWTNYSGILYLSLGFVLVGIGVKVSVVPFHLWTPDVYEGAPTPVTAYLAVVSKAAVLAFFLRVFVWIYGQKFGQWGDIIAWLSVITMIVGNIGALPQRNVKRILAYSSVGQVGYLLLPFAAVGSSTLLNDMWQALSSIAFYLFAYMFMTIGAFAVLAKVAEARASEDIDAFAGLYRRSPFLAGMMALFLLSLAGLPLTAGFFGKFMIFLVAFNAGQYWLGVILFATSAIAFYYYFGILRAMFTREPAGDQERVRSSPTLVVVVALCALGTLALGIAPSPLMDVLNGLHWFG